MPLKEFISEVVVSSGTKSWSSVWTFLPFARHHADALHPVEHLQRLVVADLAVAQISTALRSPSTSTSTCCS
jgi:hypothetical protein